MSKEEREAEQNMEQQVEQQCMKVGWGWEDARCQSKWIGGVNWNTTRLK